MSELYELPAGWEWKQLDDISKLIGGGTPKRNMNEYWDNGNIVWLSPTDLGKIGDIIYISDSKDKITQQGLDKSSAKLLPVGTVLYSSRATIGKIAINTIEVSTNQGFTNFICNENLNNRYLAYILSRFTPEITSLSNSTTFKEVSKTSLKKFQIPLPPLQEQKRIVVKLDTLFEMIDKSIALHQKNMDEVDVFMGSVLNEVFGELEDKYNIVKIEDIAKIKGGKRLPKGKKLQEQPTQHPYIRVADFLNTGTINLKKIQFITNDIYEAIKNYTITSKDLYISIAGTIGKTGIIPQKLDGANLTENAVKLVYITQNIDNKYIYFMTNSSQFKNRIGLATKTVAQPKLAIRRLAEVLLPLPPLNIQQKTVTYLDEISLHVEKLKQVQKEKMQSLVALKASILDQAFRGEL
ncbi:restriction endonuclease subunit S [Sulfurimonas hydrogeniphila]|uniref:restriction endonuclease subunit S n=1 Tax=Sulfurimonas hydrogeniphila TaxID=2509341 RepID=UPI00125F12A5|nr:restriction endonuclease subunit S [Sulfurimonas hydrogeniphila]